MSEHRTDLPEWEQIPREQWNEHQFRAAATNGWDTPGNRRTAKGLTKTLVGLAAIAKGHDRLGLFLVGLGRIDDLLDGKDARRTGTRSPKGKTLDAAADKIAMAAALPVLAKRNILSVPMASILFGLNLANTVVVGDAKRRGINTDASKEGKYATFAQWVGLGAAVAGWISKRKGAEDLAGHFQLLEDTALGVGIGAGSVALYGYGKDAITTSLVLGLPLS